MTGFVLLAATACAAPADSGNSVDLHGVPEYDGPWAAELTEYYSTAQSDFERGALRDGTISDQEYAEMTTRMSDCLQDHGIEFSGFDRTGGYDTKFPPSMGPDRANELTNECSRSSGEWSVGALYHLMQQNPDNTDWATAVAACLVARGVVAADYTAEDWVREASADEYSFVVDDENGRAAIVDCNRDPLSVLAG